MLKDRTSKNGLKLLFFIIIGIIMFPYSVNAESDNGSCQKKIIDNITITPSGKNKQMKTITIKTPNIGDYVVEYTMADYQDDVADFANDSSFTKVNKKKDGTYETISLPPGREIYIIVKLNSKYEFKNKKGKVTETCNAPGLIRRSTTGQLITDITGKDEKNNTIYLGTYVTKKIQNPPANINITSSEVYKKKSCEYMRNGIYNNNGTFSDNDIKTDYEGYKKYAEAYFPYCFNENASIPFTFSNGTINTVRQKIIKIYKSISVINQGKIVVSPGFENITPSKTTDIGVLKCNKFPTKDANGKDENNINRYVYEESKDIKSDGTTVCTVKCREELEVIYGPPVATKAGLCFTYEVTVKSKVQCETKMNKNVKLKKPDFCSPYPICEHGTHQAGPTDDFDSCVQECDGGEYSQSCINKCYKEVYNNSTKTNQNTNSNSNNQNTELLSFGYQESSSIKKIADSDDPYDIEGCKTNQDIDDNLDKCAEKLTEAKHIQPCGDYKYTSDADIGTFEWSMDENECPNIKNYAKYLDKASNYVKSIKRASPYYTRNVEATKDLLKGLKGYQAAVGLKRYIIDNDGIKRQHSSRYQCGEQCGYKGCSKNSAYNDSKAKKQYTAYLKAYEKALEKCSAAASCETKTSTFNISVNAETNSDTAWKATNATGKETDERNGDTLIFTPQNGDESKDPYDGINGICYANRKMDWQHYKTTITFPGTWINLKTGKREYKEPSNEDQYRNKTNYFCVGYDYDPVNEKWWDWKINQNGDINKTAGVTVENDKNITADIKDFGKFGWNININCFYALSNKVTTCVGANCNPSCSGAECDTTINNVKLRPVDQADLFAGRTGNQIGFNWTSAAQDKVAGNTSGYNIDPGLYAEKLQTEAKNNPNSIYSGTADYSLHLTKENIKSLRDYVDKNKGYTAYNGKLNNPVADVPGLYYYKSDILEKYTTNFSRNANILGKNNN